LILQANRRPIFNADIVSGFPSGARSARHSGYGLSGCPATSRTSSLEKPPTARPIDYRSCYVPYRRMSVLLAINRDFPFQVPLSFDEAAMEVLNWLEDSAFEWDMYVNLPEDTIRYCFRTLADAAAFKRRFGEVSERRAVAGGH
jgi:hypothetical protein